MIESQNSCEIGLAMERSSRRLSVPFLVNFSITATSARER